MKTPNVSPPGSEMDLKGMVFGGGSLLALDAPPKRKKGKWYWLCQCQLHNVKPKYFRITKLLSGEIKSCGCHGGSVGKNNDDLVGQQIGFVKVFDETRINGNRPEYLVHCVVCNTEKWVRVENLRKHTGISCVCTPRLKNRTIGQYTVLDATNRKNENGLPELLCKDKEGNEVRVLKEELLRTLAEELLAE